MRPTRADTNLCKVSDLDAVRGHEDMPRIKGGRM